MYQRIYTKTTYKVDENGESVGREVFYFDYNEVLTQILDMVEAANIPGLRPRVIEDYRLAIEERNAGRLVMYFEFEPAFGCGATLNINLSAAYDRFETRDGKARQAKLSAQIGTSGTNRDLAGTMLFADILQQVIRLAASVEAQFAGNLILEITK